MNIEITENKETAFEKVEVRKPMVADLVHAERVAGSQYGMEFMLALVSRVAKFDGQSLTAEELQSKLSAADFLEVSGKLGMGAQKV